NNDNYKILSMVIRRVRRRPKTFEDRKVLKKIGSFLISYWKIITASLLAISILISAYYIYSYFEKKKKEKASVSYANFMEKLRSVDKEGVNKEETFRTLDADVETILEEHKGTVFPQLALLNLANALYENGEYEKAKEYFERCDEISKDNLIKISCQWGIADSLYSMDKYDEASKYYSEIIDKFMGDPLLPGVLIKGAKCYIKMEKYDKALKFLYTLRSQYPDSAFTTEAEDLIKRLGG
ncbi:MAG: tetratricopeptide repeat protein, partial [bacterium]